MEKEIRVISVERDIKDLTQINDYDLRILLKKMAKECQLDIENMIALADMFYDYKPPPNINSFKEILINFILLDNKFTPYIILDITTKSTNPWEYYIPKEVPSNAIRVVLTHRKRVMIEYMNKLIPLIMPSGMPIDIKTINLSNINDIIPIFLTVKFYYIKRGIISSYTTKCKNKEYTELSFKLPIIDLDHDYIQYISTVNNKSPNRYRTEYQSIHQFIASTNNKLFLGLLYFLNNDQVNTDLLDQIRSEYDLKNRVHVNTIIRHKEEIKNSMIKGIMKRTIPDIYKKFKPNVGYSEIFKTLDDKSRDLILREYKMAEEFRNAMKNNKCPHLELVRELRTTRYMKTKKSIYEDVKKFIIDIENAKSFHKCKRCKFNIICPHITQTMNMLLDNVSEIEIRNKLDSYRDRTDDSQYEAFCKICNEELFSNTFEEVQGETYRVLYIEIFKYLWSQTLNIFVTLKITPKVNIFDFSGIIVYGILPIITRSRIPDVNNQMNMYLKSNELSMEFKGIIIIYIYAYILNMIRINIANPKESYVKISFEDLPHQMTISTYAEKVVDKLNTVHRSIFNQLADINLGEFLITIYTELATSTSIFSMQRVNSLDGIIFNEIISNTIFNYSFYIAILSKAINIDDGSNINIHEYENTIEKILGMKVGSIARGQEKNSYLKVYQPDYDNIPSIKEYKSIMKKDKISISDLSKITKGRILNSFDEYMKRFTAMSRSESTSIKISLDTEEDERKIQDTASIYYKIVTKILKSTLLWEQRTYTDDPRITCIYNENGIMHKWDVYIYNDGTEIKKGTGGLNTYKKIVDFKDRTSGIFRSQTSKLDLNRTIDSYKRNSKKKVFFNFFLIKCPDGGIHNFKEKKTCSKCGLVEGDDDNSYYKKYYKIFLDEVKKSEKEILSVGENGIIQLDKNITKKWIKNIRSIIELSKIAGVSQVVIESIGAMEYRTLDDVKVGRKRSDLPTTRYDPQLMMALSHYLSAVGFYNHTKYGSINNEDFSKYLKSSNITVGDISNIKNKMPPDLYVKHNELIESTFKDNSVTYEDKYTLIIQTLCDFIMDIHNIDDKVIKAIAKYIISSIIKAEYLTCVSNKKFDRTLFRENGSIFLSDQTENNEFDAHLDEEAFMEEGNLDYSDITIESNT